MVYSFRGGIHPDDKKAATSHKAIELLKPPDRVVIPMAMHIGAPCKPIVQTGDIVCVGQKIGDSDARVSAPIHASVSGKVIAVEPRPHPDGSKTMSVVIENDFMDSIHPSVTPKDYQSMTQDELVSVIREAGIVGHGGATFPTHVKIASAIGKVDTIIINGAECEPYITSDHRLLLERPSEIIGGIEILIKIFAIQNVLIAIESNKKDVFAGINERISGKAGVNLVPLHTKFPQGAEKQLIYTLTKREIPSGKLPADVGCVVFNIDTAGAIYRAFKSGMPDIRRIVTVSGSAIPNPKNLEVRVGTPLRSLVEACGGFKEEPNKLIMGGPMMGVAQFDLDAPVIKATNAFLALSGTEDAYSKNPTCIRCGKCVEACPMRLMPVYIYSHFQKERLEECANFGALDCIECGCCSFECPGRLPLVQTFRVAKQRILESRRK